MGIGSESKERKSTGADYWTLLARVFQSLAHGAHAYCHLPTAEYVFTPTLEEESSFHPSSGPPERLAVRAMW